MASLSQCTEDIIIIPYIITPTALKTRSLHPCGCHDTHRRPKHSFQTKNTHSWQRRSMAVTPPPPPAGYRAHVTGYTWTAAVFGRAIRFKWHPHHMSAAPKVSPAEHQCYSFHLLVLLMLRLIRVYQNQVFLQEFEL